MRVIFKSISDAKQMDPNVASWFFSLLIWNDQKHSKSTNSFCFPIYLRKSLFLSLRIEYLRTRRQCKKLLSKTFRACIAFFGQVKFHGWFPKCFPEVRMLGLFWKVSSFNGRILIWFSFVISLVLPRMSFGHRVEIFI